MTSAAPLISKSIKKHAASVIIAHGLGDTGMGWVWFAENVIRRGKLQHVSFIFPNAPNIPITVNMGMRMPGWYDIRSFDDIAGREEDEAGINRSREYFHGLVDAEVAKGIPAHRVVLGGFSQGGAMSLNAGVTYKEKLGGIFGLSSYLLQAKKLKDMIPSDSPNKETPIFMGHGDADNVVQYQYGKLSAEQLSQLGFKVDFRTYKDLSHSADPEEIDHLVAYLQQQLPPLDDAEC